MRKLLAISGAVALLTCAVNAQDLPVEPLPKVETLPESYPDHWIYVHDVNFMSLIDGKVVLLDPMAETRQYKGAVGAGQFASFIAPRTRPEFYVAETFYSRGTRGERTDVLTIYDRANLAPIGEVALPGGKRSLSVTQKASLGLSADEKFLYLFNFTPAASVSIIDLDARLIVNEIQIPGCSLVYPFGMRSFGTLCGNGSMTTFTLDDGGQLASRQSSRAFNPIDEDPLFMKTALLGDRTYFPSFKGRVQAIEYGAAGAVPVKGWAVAGSAAAGGAYRPAGWQVIAASEETGKLYLLMNEGAGEGDHKNGGGEVWVIDPESGAVESRYALKSWGLSIEITGGAKPLLVVSTIKSEIEVYDAANGGFVRMIGGDLAISPFVMHAVR
ncbi:amine dehydrogenase large subunit [Kordiimonas sp.]|uniref:amine dehydrogenase large subunit n=1 Tax=Kordiimonas sp. TaxID=1970157 RepID=UPI003A913F22